MKHITSKTTVLDTIEACDKTYLNDGVLRLSEHLHSALLDHKVKFPLLEYAGGLLFERIDETDHIPLCDLISKGDTIGGNVVIGTLLQLHLHERLAPTMHAAARYISSGTEWYVADIIGERVIGHALLQDEREALRVMHELKSHHTNLVVRSLGAGIHLALKRGLNEKAANACFALLLELADSKDHQIKRGIGWAAKTTAKFYPNIIERHRSRIDDSELVGQWFRTKVKIGLERNRYAATR